MEVMGLMLGDFVDEYTVKVVDVFAMPQSGTGVSVEAVDPVFQTTMLDMLKQVSPCLQYSVCKSYIESSMYHVSTVHICCVTQDAKHQLPYGIVWHHCRINGSSRVYRASDVLANEDRAISAVGILIYQ